MVAAERQVSRGWGANGWDWQRVRTSGMHFHISAGGARYLTQHRASLLSSCAGTPSNMSQTTWRSGPHPWGAQSVRGMGAQAPARACGSSPPHHAACSPLNILRPSRIPRCCAVYFMARQSQLARHISCAAAYGPAAWRQPLAAPRPSLLLVRRGHTPLSICLPHGATGLVPSDPFILVGTTLIARRKPAPAPGVASTVSWAPPPAWHPSTMAPALPPLPTATTHAVRASAVVRQKRLTTPPTLQEPPAKHSRVSTAPTAAPLAEWRLAPPSRHVAATHPGRPAAASTLAAWAAMRNSLGAGASGTEAPFAAASQVPGYQAGSPLMTWLGKFAAMLSPGQAIP